MKFNNRSLKRIERQIICGASFWACVCLFEDKLQTGSLLIRKMPGSQSLPLPFFHTVWESQLNIDECHQTHTHTYAAPPWLGFPLLWPWVTQKLVHRHNIHMFEAHKRFLALIVCGVDQGQTLIRSHRMNDQIVSKTTTIFHSDASTFALKEPFLV